MNDLWYGTSGPQDAEIVLVGESWGLEESQAKRPFVGSSGTELTRILVEANLDRSKILITNTIADRPQNNETWRYFHSRDTPSNHPIIGGCDPSLFLREELGRLYQQINYSPRKLVIATGNYPLWAISNCTGTVPLRNSNNRPIPKELQPKVPNGIMNWRGSMWYCEGHKEIGPLNRVPLLPIIHPAAIMRQWENRDVTVHDLKARVKLALKSDWRHKQEPEFWAPPTYDQCCHKLCEWIGKANAGADIYLTEDIETFKSLMTCIGLTDSKSFAMCIPFVRVLDDSTLGSYWSETQEAQIIRLLRKVHSHPNIHTIGQNFAYDTQYIQFWHGVTPRLEWDTMLCQNVLFPGTPKGLDYLSSLYCYYHWYWKEDGKEWNGKGRLEDLLVYNCWDLVRTHEVSEIQRQLVRAAGQESQMRDKMKIDDLCRRMMNRGVRIDKSKRNQVSLDLLHAMTSLENELHAIIPQDMVSPENGTPWFRSSQQTQYLYYDRLGFDVRKDRKTGQPSVGKEARMALHKQYPEFGGLFERLRMYGSAEDTYDVVNAGLDSDDRMRCFFSSGGTETHRLASRKNAFGRGTNLQNLTKGEEDD
jgi:uracil-DNA glycosylase